MATKPDLEANQVYIALVESLGLDNKSVTDMSIETDSKHPDHVRIHYQGFYFMKRDKFQKIIDDVAVEEEQ